MIVKHHPTVPGSVPVTPTKRLLRTVTAIFACALLAGSAKATDYAWTTGSGYWTNPVLWGVASYPGQLSSADTATWTNTVTLMVTENTSLTNATVYFRNPANAVTLQMTNAAVLTVTNAFLIGDLSTSTGSVTLAGSGTLAVTNGGTAQVIIGQSGQGTLTLNGGNLIADQIISTNNTTGFGSQLALGANAASGSVTVLNGSLWNVCTNHSFNTGLSFGGTWNFLGGTNLVTNVFDSSYSYLNIAPSSVMTVAGSNTVFNSSIAITNASQSMLQIQGALIVSNQAHMLVQPAGYYATTYYTQISCDGPPATGQLIKVDNAYLTFLRCYMYMNGWYTDPGFCHAVGIIVTNNGVFSQTSDRGFDSISFGNVGRGDTSYYVNSNNYISVTMGGIFTNRGLYMGQNSGCSITIASGGRMFSGGGSSEVLDTTLSDVQSGSVLSRYGYNSALITGPNSTWVMPYCSLWLGRGDLGATNQSAFNTSLIISNSGTAYFKNLYVSVANSSGVTVTNNFVTIDNGYLYVTNSASSAITLGSGGISSGALTIRNGGLVMANNLFTGVGTGTGMVTVTSGGVLEANVISNNTTAGSYNTNNGGIYQFSTTTPTLVPNGAGNIAVNNGGVSFRAVTNADVMSNWNGPLTNLTFSGANNFRLNAATNTAAASQTYVFDPSLGVTNYAGLEMVNGATRYRGQAGNTLVIGSGGQMLCSHTAAVVDLPFTNNGTLTLINSTLSFATNATFNGSLHIDAGHLLSLTATVLASNLTLGASSSLVVTGVGTNATLITYTALSGGFSSITAPTGYGISVANGQVRLLKTFGTSCFFR